VLRDFAQAFLNDALTIMEGIAIVDGGKIVGDEDTGIGGSANGNEAGKVGWPGAGIALHSASSLPSFEPLYDAVVDERITRSLSRG
jgi:hypothetical protein